VTNLHIMIGLALVVRLERTPVRTASKMGLRGTKGTAKIEQEMRSRCPVHIRTRYVDAQESMLLVRCR
jgi:hypothetical protein